MTNRPGLRATLCGCVSTQGTWPRRPVEAKFQPCAPHLTVSPGRGPCCPAQSRCSKDGSPSCLWWGLQAGSLPRDRSLQVWGLGLAELSQMPTNQPPSSGAASFRLWEAGYSAPHSHPKASTCFSGYLTSRPWRPGLSQVLCGPKLL